MNAPGFPSAEASKRRTLRLFYAAGPGDIIGTYRNWSEGKQDPSQVSVTYSSQFWDVCKRSGAESLAVSSHPRKDELIDGAFRIEHRPRPFPSASGAGYHVGELCYGLWIIASIVLFRADFAIVAEGSTQWFVLALLQVCGIRVIPTVHCVIWPKHKPISRVQRVLNAVNKRLFFRSRTHAVLSASEDITGQLKHLGCRNRIVEFLPTYKKELFDGIADAPATGPFRILFAGRIEENKGVFALLQIAIRYREEGYQGIEFDLCGNGSALAALRERIENAKLSESFTCHGHCTRETMRKMFQRCHLVLVPTTTDFNEGFNQVVVEGVLAGRPVITSSVCPALASVRDAVVEVDPDDIDAYHDAILRLRDDPALYHQKKSSCIAYQNRFYDESYGWSAALSSALR